MILQQINRHTDEVVGEYMNVRVANRITGVKIGHIYKVLQGRRELAGGYKWFKVK